MSAIIELWGDFIILNILPIYPSLHPNPWQLLIFLTIFIVLSLTECHIVEII